MNADCDDTDTEFETLTALAERFDELAAVRSAAVHTPQSRVWIEVLDDGLVLGPPVLREIADHHPPIAAVITTTTCQTTGAL